MKDNGINGRRTIRVLVVDDSAFMRRIITDFLESDARISVIGTARNGRAAAEKTRNLKPDVVTLDYMMPERDGLETLEDLIGDFSVPVVMVSSYTPQGADITLKALHLGAVDFVLKPSKTEGASLESFKRELIVKVKIAAVASPQAAGHLVEVVPEEYPKKKLAKLGKIVVIGSSTGGPQALQRVVPFIPKNIQASILIVQHMPPTFTKSLADRLDNESHIKVVEARDGDRVRPGKAFLNPGDYHMTLDGDGSIHLNQDSPIGGLRPRVDVTMESVSALFGENVIGVILTGMGSDGARGMSSIKKHKGRTIVQDESTCVVYGMPKSVIKLGSADKVLKIDDITKEIVRMTRG